MRPPPTGPVPDPVPDPTSNRASDLSDDFALDAVDLTVSDLDRAGAFYRGVLGLVPLSADGDTDRGSTDERAEHEASSDLAADDGATPDDGVLRLGAGGRELVRLTAQAGAKRSPTRATGLYHLALLLPSRAALGRFLADLIEHRTPVVGAADHAVSEAIYLEDPDGHGVEVYADRPRDAWTWREGRIAMTTDPLDTASLLDAAGEATNEVSNAGSNATSNARSNATSNDGWRAPAGTRLGHVHLRVRDVDEARRFYVATVGFDEVAAFPGAAFLSVAGYHHHLGVNAWQSAGASPAPASNARLQRVRASVGRSEELDALRRRVAAGGHGDDPVAFRDPSGTAWTVRARERRRRA